MEKVKIILICPKCGKSAWQELNEDKFKCINCGDVCHPDYMCFKTKKLFWDFEY